VEFQVLRNLNRLLVSLCDAEKHFVFFVSLWDVKNCLLADAADTTCQLFIAGGFWHNKISL